VALFADTRAVAAAVPGFTLSDAGPSHAEETLAVALGPIRARFAGRALIERDDTLPGGSILAAGSDGTTGAQARGRIDYRIRAADEGSGAVIDLTIAYALGGLLAQLGRPALIEALARDLLARFAAALASGTTPAVQKPLSIVSLLGALFGRSAGALFRRGKGDRG